jgi:hypothetical protein
MVQRVAGPIEEAFAAALAEVMEQDYAQAQDDVRKAVEQGDEVLLVDASLRLHAAVNGYDMILDNDLFDMIPPDPGTLCWKLELLARQLGEYLHRQGRWFDPAVVSGLLEEMLGHRDGERP